jgi:hypothetical protein
MPDLFDRLGQSKSVNPNQPQIATADVVLKPHPQRPAVKKLLDWLVYRWPKPTITVREVQIYGPQPRDGKTAKALVAILAEQKWIIPVEARRRNQREWEIVRRPTPR